MMKREKKVNDVEEEEEEAISTLLTCVSLHSGRQEVRGEGEEEDWDKKNEKTRNKRKNEETRMREKTKTHE